MLRPDGSPNFFPNFMLVGTKLRILHHEMPSYHHEHGICFDFYAYNLSLIFDQYSTHFYKTCAKNEIV